MLRHSRAVTTGKIVRVAVGACVLAACGESRISSGPEPFASQGVVDGFIRDEAGRGVPNVVVCAASVLNLSGTPLLISNQISTNPNGGYVIPVNLSIQANVRTGLTVTANPPAGSGLDGKMASGLSLLVTTNLPPAETTHVDMVLAPGTPPGSVLCTYGG
ncbi:MAG: hypothetical protein ACJ8AJ_11500 [Gemmatimonadaceae bacterium]